MASDIKHENTEFGAIDPGMDPLKRAIQIAAEAHAGQVDKGGKPYILHPLRVMLAMTTDEERIVAVLHDALEDGPWPIEIALKHAQFSPAVMVALDALTKRPKEAYADFIARVKLNPLATRVKLADMRDNSDLSRIPNPTEKDRARRAKYQRYIAELDDQPPETPV